MFKAYCDESGTERDAKILVLAGLLAPAVRWKRFETDWKLVLASHGVCYFRAHDFYKRKEQFALGTVWDNRLKREQFIQQLLQVIQSRETAPALALVSLVYLAAHQRIFGKSRLSSTPYTVGCSGCWLLASKWAEEENHKEEIAFIFDNGHKNDRHMLEVYQRAQQYGPFRQEFRLGGLSFEDDRTTTPLQAADLLAYGMTRSLRIRGDWRDVDSTIQQYVGKSTKYQVFIAEEELLQSMHDEQVTRLRQRGKKI
jgi:Protein of unknown function (DUF3800)